MPLKATLFSLVLLLCSPFALSADSIQPPFAEPIQIIPAPPQLSAKSFTLIDPLSNYIIAEHNIDTRAEPASLTKMMTVYVVDHAIKNGKLTLADQVKISEKAWRAPGTRMFVALDSEVKVEDLLRGIIIQSGNDASLALAEYTAGSEEAFAELMNYYAKQLKMTNTHFMNATGLPDPDHYTTARDMATLAKALMRDFPETYKLYSEKEFTYNNVRQENRNNLLWRNEYVDGIKTGHTDSAGYCLVASGKKDNMRLIAVVMGTSSNAVRMDEANKLLTYGFRFYETRKLYDANTALTKARIWLGNQKEIEAGLKEDLYITIGQGQATHLKTAFNVDNTVKAPVSEGMPVGTLVIQLKDKTLLTCPLVALSTVEAGSFFNRMYDKLALTVHNLLNKASQ